MMLLLTDYLHCSSCCNYVEKETIMHMLLLKKQLPIQIQEGNIHIKFFSIKIQNNNIQSFSPPRTTHLTQLIKYIDFNHALSVTSPKKSLPIKLCNETTFKPQIYPHNHTHHHLFLLPLNYHQQHTFKYLQIHLHQTLKHFIKGIIKIQQNNIQSFPPPTHYPSDTMAQLYINFKSALIVTFPKKPLLSNYSATTQHSNHIYLLVIIRTTTNSSYQ